jgi:hypothetical protein
MKSDEIVSIYTSFKDDSKGWLGLHHQHFTQFVTIISAVLAVSIAAISQFQNNGWLLLFVVIGPIFNIILCFTATKVCDRFYQRFLEHETVAMKLFLLSGLSQSFSKEVEKRGIELFPESTHLFPERWVNAMSGYGTVEKFVQDYLNKGSNRLIRRTFRTLAIFNVIIGIAVIVFAVASFV